MEERGSSIAQFLHGKTIFITGSTGFLAKVLLEKILRIQPEIKRIFLLIRARKEHSVEHILYKEIMETDLFKVLKETWGFEGLRSLLSEKVVAVCGDISLENLGIQDSHLRNEMWREIDIVVNSAATTNFFERYDTALKINTWGAMHVLNFINRCSKAKVLVHVSTAYVCGENAGIIPEKPFSMAKTLDESSDIDIDAETKLADKEIKEPEAEGKASSGEIKLAMKDLGIKRAREHGWPNTYVFTKAMGEMMLEMYKGKMEVVIIRPTIISSTYKEPFPGWIEGLRTMDSILLAYGKGNLKCYVGNPETIMDLIPCDMVVNSILMGIVTHSVKSRDHHIYHVGSSLRNPIKYGDIHGFFHSYFSKNPWINDGGKSVKVEHIKVIKSIPKFRRYVATHYTPFLKALNIANILLCGKLQVPYMNLKRNINSLLLLTDVYGPYTFFQGIFHDGNIEELKTIARDYGFKNNDLDPTFIQWEKYFIGTHIPMVVKYLF